MGVEITTAKPIKGRDVFYFVQSVKAPLGSAAKLPAWRTDGSVTRGGESIDEQTQQGRLVEKVSDEHSIELSHYFAPDDEAIKIIEDAQKTGQSVKIWRVMVDESVKKDDSGNDTYPAEFGYARIEEIEKDDAIDGYVEVSYTANIIDSLKDGYFPLTAEEIELIRSVYAYQNPGETTGDYDSIKKD